MTTVAPSAAPPTAVRIWPEGRDLLVEFPSKSGIPYIMRIAATASAVSTVLNLIRGADHRPPQRRSFAKDTAQHPMVRKVTATDSFSAEQKANARAVLKRMGIT